MLLPETQDAYFSSLELVVPVSVTTLFEVL
jgi:hypothetical protein